MICVLADQERNTRNVMEHKGEQLISKDIKMVLFKIKPSLKYDGVGVFALRDIKKGTIICDVEKIDEEYFISHEEVEGLDSETKQVMIDFCAQDKDGFYTPLDLNYLSVPCHMNHHCNGNVGCDENNFIAIKDIKKGQELCFDYALVISNPKYKLKCKCGDEKCRKVITGNDWKDKAFIKKNYQYMASLQRELVYSALNDFDNKFRNV